MQVNSVINSNNQMQTSFGNKKIPRFLYHLTTEDNYLSMLGDKKIFAYKGPTDPIHGIFMLDLVNFFKRWNILKESDGENLKEKLITQVTKGDFTSKIVALKIPTKNLDKPELRIRSLKLYFSAHKRKGFDKALEDWLDTGRIPKGELSYYYLGDKAEKAKVYKQKGEAIEYVYPQTIRMSNVEKIGEVEFNKDENMPLKEIYTNLFKNTPEEKALKAWKD